MHPLRVNNPEAGEMIQIIAADASGNITVGGESVMCVRACVRVCVYMRGRGDDSDHRSRRQRKHHGRR